MRHKSTVSTLRSTVITALACWPSSALADDPVLTPEVIATYDPAALQTPESVATDYAGNIYISLALTGEISRIDPSGVVDTLAMLPIDTPLEECFGFVSGQTALTYTPWGLYVNVNSCNPSDRGIWWVSTITGAMAKVASTPTETFVNGIAHRFGYIYASDSFSEKILRVPVWGGPATVWVEDPLLEPAGVPGGTIGANGLQFYGDEMYVSNSATGDIVAFEIEWNQAAGASRLHATVEDPCDDFAFDLYGTIYCGTNFNNTIVAIGPDGETEVLLSGHEFLDGPSSAAFGRFFDSHTLYISNASFPFYPNNGSPSVIALELDVQGYPFR